jgi:hypothetical protein
MPGRDEWRDRVGLFRATLDLHERPRHLVCERTTRQSLGIRCRRESHLHRDPRVQRRADNSRPPEFREVHRYEIRPLPPAPHRGGPHKGIVINRLRSREPNRQAPEGGPDRRDGGVTRPRVHRLHPAAITRMHVHSDRTGVLNGDCIAGQFGRGPRYRGMLSARAPAVQTGHHRHLSLHTAGARRTPTASTDRMLTIAIRKSVTSGQQVAARPCRTTRHKGPASTYPPGEARRGPRRGRASVRCKAAVRSPRPGRLLLGDDRTRHPADRASPMVRPCRSRCRPARSSRRRRGRAQSGSTRPEARSPRDPARLPPRPRPRSS